MMRVIDLFSGAGGLSLGFMEAGYDVVAAFDNWKPAVATYKANFGHPISTTDLSDTDEAIDEIRGFAPKMIIGGPPCQDFSSAGKRDETLGRADLTIAYAEIVSSIQPEWFVMENVERAAKSWTFARARDILTKAGYGLTVRVLDASRCGVPQRRKRLFLIGQQGGQADALGPALDSGQSSRSMTLREYFGDDLGVEHYYRHPRSYARRGIFSIDEPSPTVRGVNRPIPDGYPGHPGDTAPLDGDVRSLTTKERSLIQTFPMDFRWVGTKTDKEQLIGNAVPVGLAYYVASCIAEYQATGAAGQTQLRLVDSG